MAPGPQLNRTRLLERHDRRLAERARALVAPGTVVKAGWIWAGRPAFAFRAIKPQEREAFAEAAQIYVGYGAAYRRGRLVAPSRSGR